MGTQQFCLKWNNHHSNMLAVFEQLLSSEALVDVTLACEGLSLKAHKMVLSACSPFFQSLFLENPCKHPIVILKDMRYTDLKAIIDFMYRGEVNVSQDQLSALLKTAETLKVKGLAEVTGDNRQGNGSGIVQQEIVQHNSTPQSTVPASGATTQHRAESPPLSRRKRGRPRRRSLSDSNRSDSEDQIPSKIKEPDSPEIIEDVNNELSTDGVDVRQRLVSVPPLNQQSQVSSQPPNVPHLPPIASHKPHPALPSIHTQDARNVNMDENPSGDEGEFDVDASKLMEQTMTTENVPVFADGQTSGSSILPVSTQVALTSSTSGIVDTRPLQISQVPASDSQNLVPVADQPVVVHTSQDTTQEWLSEKYLQQQPPDNDEAKFQPLQETMKQSEPTVVNVDKVNDLTLKVENSQDCAKQNIKPMVSFEEPPISPVAGPSHGQDNSSSSMMMYMDTSGVPAIAGPSNYQSEKQTSSQQQQQSTQGPADGGPVHGTALPITHVCKLCGKFCQNDFEYRRHLIPHRFSHQKLTCHFCPQTFYWKNTLFQHLKEVHPSEVPPGTSPELVMPFSFEGSKKRILKRKKKKKKGRQPGSRLCGICKKIFSNSSEYSSHMAKHGCGGVIEPGTGTLTSSLTMVNPDINLNITSGEISQVVCDTESSSIYELEDWELNTTDAEEESKIGHFPVLLPPRPRGAKGKRRCRVCIGNDKRTVTVYCCSGCNDNPPLCVLCFRYYKHVN